jgi:hypothetical protein
VSDEEESAPPTPTKTSNAKVPSPSSALGDTSDLDSLDDEDDEQNSVSTSDDEDKHANVNLMSGFVDVGMIILNDRLFNADATADDVLEDVTMLFPSLVMSQPHVRSIRARIRELPRQPPHFPDNTRHPLTRSSVHPIIDHHWAEMVENEPAIKDPPTGLDMRESLLVKPFGSMEAPLTFLSSYPTKHPGSTVHMDDATVNDLSNICMFYLYTKLGFHRVNLRASSMLHLDLFPRRLDRVKMGSGLLLRIVGSVLRKYCEHAEMNLLAQSKALLLLLLVSNSTAGAYAHYVKRTGIKSLAMSSIVSGLSTSLSREIDFWLLSAGRRSRLIQCSKRGNGISTRESGL